MRRLVLIAALAAIPVLAVANVIRGVDASGTARTVRVDSSGFLASSTSAQVDGAFGAVAVTDAVGGSTIGGLAGRRTIIIQNRGPNTIYCGVSAAGTAPTTATGLGLPSNGERAYDVAAGLVLKCIAETAAQVSPADTRYQEIG